MNRPKWYYHVFAASALLFSIAALLAAYRPFSPRDYWVLDSGGGAFNPRTAVLCGYGVGDTAQTYISCRNWRTGQRVHSPDNPFAKQ